MELTCTQCGTISKIPSSRLPYGRSYTQCPGCGIRLNIFKGFRVGQLIRNLAGIRFLRSDGNIGLDEEYCDPGENWRVEAIVEPCPDKGKARSCEMDNFGRCPNQRMVVRLSGDKRLHKTCMYRGGRKIFAVEDRMPVGNVRLSSASQLILRAAEKQAQGDSASQKSNEPSKGDSGG